MKETHRKGDSLETLRSGIYQGMNTAVILNQSSVLHANEWKGGHHYPIFPSGYHRPVQNLLPLAGLKQLSLGKIDNTWANLNGVYSPQIPMVQIFSPSNLTMKVMQEQSQRSTQIRMTSTANVPRYSPTLTQSNTKRTVQSFAPLNPTQFCKTANLVNPKTTAGQHILPSNIPDVRPRATQTNTKTTQGYQQSVIQNFGGYIIEKPSNAINVKPPSSSAVNLTELSPYKKNLTTKSAQAKQQELLQTRKRSSSWPPGSGLSKKKPKEGLTKDDQMVQIIEEYKNLEMDVARILIRDIPFPVVSVGGVEASFVRSGGGQEADRQAEMSAVANGGILESEKQGSGSIPRSGGMHVQSRSALESGGKKLLNERASLWSGGVSEFNTQSTVVHGGDREPEKQETMSRSDGWSGGEPNKEATKSTAGGGALTGSENQGGTPEATKQTNMSTFASETVEPEKGGNRSNAWSGEMAEPTNQADISPMGSSESNESNQQAKVSPLWSGGETEPEKQMNTLNTCSGATQEPNKQVNNSVQGGVGLELQKRPSNTESRASLHLENEKENYSKNMMNPNKVVFTCEQCMVTFESTQDLISHTASHTSSNFTFKCNVCTQVFRSTNGLQKHIEFHADHRNNFQCSFCFKPFSDRDSLEEHIIESHMSKRPHKCSYCPKAFRDPGSLQKHTRIHTGERPYKCTACEKSFAEYSSLRKHYRVHTGEQPYKCQYCSKAFSISGNLQRHILIHTGERPYKCSECSKTFNNPSHLRRHEKNLHSKLEREK